MTVKHRACVRIGRRDRREIKKYREEEKLDREKISKKTGEE